MAMDLKSAYGLNGSGVGCVVYTPTLTISEATHAWDNRGLAQDLIVGKHYKVTIDNFQYIKGDQKGFTIREYNYDTGYIGDAWNITSEPGPVTLDIPYLHGPDLLIYNGIMGDTIGNSMSFTNIRVFVVEDIGGNLLPNSGGVSYSNYLWSNSNVVVKYQLSGNTSYPELKVTHSGSGVWGIYYNVSNSIGYYDNRLVKAGSIYNVSFQIWTDSAITAIGRPFSELSPTDYGSDLTVTPQVWKNCWYVAKPSASGNMTFYVNSNTNSTFYIRNIRVTECTENDTYYMAWIPSYDSHELNTKLPDVYETSSLLDIHNRPRDTYHFQPNCRLPSTLTKIGWPLGGDMKSGIQVLENSASTENYRYSSYFNMPAGTNYQVSFWAKCSSNLKNADVFVLPDNYQGEGLNTVTFPVNCRWQFFRYIFTSPSTWVSPVRIRFDNNGSTNGSKASLWFKGFNITTDSDTSNSLKDWEGYKYQIATYIDTSTGEWVYDGTTRTREVYDRANILWSDSSSSGWIDFGTTTETETAVLSSLSLISNSSNMPTSGTGANSGAWVKANGGVCTVKVMANYKFNDEETVAVDVTDDCTYSYTSNGTGTWDSTNHTMTIPSAGTTITDNTYTNIVYVTYNGITREDLNFGRQANAVTSVSTPTGGTLTAAAIPASGGTINSGTVGGTVSQTRTFTSGATDVYSVSTPTGGTFNSVTASNLGTTIKNSTVVGTLTYTYTLNGKTGTIGTTIAQQGNFVVSLAITGGALSYNTIAAKGGDGLPTVSTQTVTYTFTSGSTSTTAPSSTYGTYSFSVVYSWETTAQNGFTLHTDSNGKTTGIVMAPSYGTTVGNARSSGTIVRTGTGIWTPTSAYNGQGTKTATTVLKATCTQSGNYVTGLSLSGGTFSYANISAGSTSANPTLNSPVATFTFTSGSTSTTTPSTTYGTLTTTQSYSLSASQNGFTAVNSSNGTLTATSYGTTVGSARTSGTVTRKITSTWTPTASYNSAGTKTATISTTATCTQNANTTTSITYGTPSITFSYGTIAASGGTVNPSLSYSQSRTQNYTSGATSTLTAVTTGASVSYAKVSGNGTVNTSTGAVTASSRGTTVDTANTTAATVRVTVTLNSKSATKDASAAQIRNHATSITYGTPSVSVTCNDVPASGGSVTSGTANYSQSRTQNYTSGSTSTLAALTSGGTVTWSGGASNIASLGTTIKARTAVGSALKATVTLNSKSGTGQTTVYQQANTWYDKRLVLSGVSSVSAAGANLSYKSTVYRGYTSGSELAVGDTYGNVTSNQSWATASGLSIIVSSRGTTVGEARSATIQSTYAGLKSNSITLTQEANKQVSSSDSGGVITYGNVTAGAVSNKTIPASGGSATATAGNGSQTWSKTAVIRTYKYTSGSTSQTTVTAATSGTNAVAPNVSSKTGTASSKGTVISNQTTVASQQVTWSANGKSASAWMYVYQAANAITSTSGSVSLSYTPSRIDYTGGSAYPNLSVTAISKFTSGSSKSRTLSSSEYSATYGGAANSYGTITASRNSGSERSFTATVTVTSNATA